MGPFAKLALQASLSGGIYVSVNILSANDLHAPNGATVLRIKLSSGLQYLSPPIGSVDSPSSPRDYLSAMVSWRRFSRNVSQTVDSPELGRPISKCGLDVAIPLGHTSPIAEASPDTFMRARCLQPLP